MKRISGMRISQKGYSLTVVVDSHETRHQENKRIRNIVSRETRHIYTSVVRKIDRAVSRENAFFKHPYTDERDSPRWRSIKLIVGALLFQRVIRATFALHGWDVRVVPDPSSTFTFTKSPPKLTVTVKGIKTPLTVAVDLPVLDTPVWCPRRYGGSWSVLELHEQGDAYVNVRDLIHRIGFYIDDNIPTDIEEFVIHPYADNDLPILLTPHVCRITHTDLVPFKGPTITTTQSSEGV